MAENMITLENIATNFNKMNREVIFLKEQLVEFKDEEKVHINFRDCHVAICPNGGLIAVCKKKGFLDIRKGSRLNDNIIVMHQNSKKKYFIPIDWDYREKWIVALDFNEKEQLYGICNEGSILKMDLLNLKAVQKITSEKLQTEGVSKVKFIGSGVIVLTIDGNFYHIPDIKNPDPKLLFPMNSLLHFSNNVDFIAIPPEHSKTNHLELLITNEKGNGVIHIEKNEDNVFGVQQAVGGLAIKGASFIERDRVEQYIQRDEEVDEKERTVIEAQHENLGKIVALAISPSKNQIALYDPRGYVYFFHSTLDKDLGKYPRCRAIIEIDNEATQNEILEQQTIINYQEGYQFLFCGEDAIALSGQRFIFLINTLNKTLIYKVTESGEIDAMQGVLFSKCNSEVDGLRYLTNDGVFLIYRVPIELYETCDPFSASNTKKLLKAYQNSLDKKVNSEKVIREISVYLSPAIEALQVAAAHIFWNEEEKNDNKDQDNNNKGKENEKKKAQIFMLQAAQYGKSFVQKGEFNFDRFLETCKEIRVMNNLRSHSSKPRYITFKEYRSLEPKDLIKKTIRQLNFGLAFEISHYLDYSDKSVYKKFAFAYIKKIRNNMTPDQEEKLFEILDIKLRNVPNLSYIKIAKKAFKHNKNIIGQKFLENEKSILIKIPQYIEMKNWDKALSLSCDLCDSNIISTVLDKILKINDMEKFIDIVSNHPKAKPEIVTVLRKTSPNDLEKYLEKYSTNMKTWEELFFYYIEKFFKSDNIKNRKDCIQSCREYEKKIDSNTFDHKFYKSYLDSLEKSLIFKTDCMEKDNIIKQNDTQSYDLSIYDCYKYGVKAEKYNWIESQNKHFGLPIEGLSLMRMNSYGELGTTPAIDALVKKYNCKKLGVNNLNIADIYFKYNKYDRAAEQIKLVNDPFYFEYKIDMLMYMERYEDALEVLISDKNCESNESSKDMIHDILSRKPLLKNKAREMCNKYKVSLGI